MKSVAQPKLIDPGEMESRSGKQVRNSYPLVKPDAKVVYNSSFEFFSDDGAILSQVERS